MAWHGFSASGKGALCTLQAGWGAHALGVPLIPPPIPVELQQRSKFVRHYHYQGALLPPRIDQLQYYTSVCAGVWTSSWTNITIVVDRAFQDLTVATNPGLSRRYLEPIKVHSHTPRHTYEPLSTNQKDLEAYNTTWQQYVINTMQLVLVHSCYYSLQHCNTCCWCILHLAMLPVSVQALQYVTAFSFYNKSHSINKASCSVELVSS